MTPSRRDRGARRVLPFTLHQVAEYGLGAYAVLQSGNVAARATATVALLGASAIAIAMISDGGAGLLRWVPPVAHRLLDVGVIAIAVVSPWVFGFGDDVASVVIVESFAVALLVLSGFTRYRSPRAGLAAPVTVRPRTRVAGYVVGKTVRQTPRALGRMAGRAARNRRSRS